MTIFHLFLQLLIFAQFATLGTEGLFPLSCHPSKNLLFFLIIRDSWIVILFNKNLFLTFFFLIQKLNLLRFSQQGAPSSWCLIFLTSLHHSKYFLTFQHSKVSQDYLIFSPHWPLISTISPRSPGFSQRIVFSNQEMGTRCTHR